MPWSAHARRKRAARPDRWCAAGRARGDARSGDRGRRPSSGTDDRRPAAGPRCRPWCAAGGRRSRRRGAARGVCIVGDVDAVGQLEGDRQHEPDQPRTCQVEGEDRPPRIEQQAGPPPPRPTWATLPAMTCGDDGGSHGLADRLLVDSSVIRATMSLTSRFLRARNPYSGQM